MPYLVSVKDYGARGDGVTDDAAAIQAALDSVPAGGGTVYLPPGDYRIGTTLAITVSGTTFKGAGASASVLRLADGVKVSGVGIPGPFSPVMNPADVVDGVTVSDLCLDGNHNANPSSGYYYPLFAAQTSNLLFTRNLVRNWPSDGFSASNGNTVNTNLTVSYCRFDGNGRNGIHFGFVCTGLIDNCYVTDCPSQYWGAAAGNGIDVEVEGNNQNSVAWPGAGTISPSTSPYVYGLTISNNVIRRVAAATAGDAIALQPAYGPAQHLTVSGNVLCGYQLAVETTGSLGLYGVAAGISDVTVENNWVADDAAIAVAGYPFAVSGASGVTVQNNISNDINPNGYFSYGPFVADDGSSDVTVTGNTVRLNTTAANAVVRAYNSAATLSVTNNNYQANGGTVVNNSDGTATGITQSGNTDISGTAWDQTAPAVSLSVADGTTLTAPTAVTVTAADSGAGVARVFFYLDGMPQGFKTSAPFTWTVDPSLLQPGAHTLSAFAVDNAANLSAETVVNFAVPVPFAASAPGSMLMGV